jgi:hypothetical protein
MLRTRHGGLQAYSYYTSQVAALDGFCIVKKQLELGRLGRAPYGVATLRASLRSVLRTLRPYMRLTRPHPIRHRMVAPMGLCMGMC